MSKKVFRNLIFIGIILAIASFCFYDIASVLAADNNSVAGGLDTVAGGAGLANADLKVLIGKILKIILGFLGIIAVCLVLYGGFLYMTSGGEQEKVSTAKKYITNALIGLVIILLSYSIVAFVMKQITGAFDDPNYIYQCADGKDNDGDSAVDWPEDKGCLSANYYSEKSGFDINGYGLLKTDQFSPPPVKQQIINVHPRISFNQAISEATVNLSNIQITAAAGNVLQTVLVKPKKVTEHLAHGTDILEQIMNDDGVLTSDWVVCANETDDPAYLGGTPMLIEYTMSAMGTDKSGKLKFESTQYGAGATMDIFCGKTETDLTKIKEDWLPPDGANEVDINPACLGGSKMFIKWVRKGTQCLKFDYIQVEVVEEVPNVVRGEFKFWNSGHLVEFVPEGVCDPLNPDAYALKKDTEYTVTLKNKESASDKIGLKAASGDALFCETTHPCTFKFTTGDICDVTPPTVNFDAFDKNVCQFPVGSEADRMVPFTAEDDIAVSVVSLYVDPKGDATDQAIGAVTQTDTVAPEKFSSSLPWAVNDYPLGANNFAEHKLMLLANDIDGNQGTKKMDVILRPDFCCDATGAMLKCTDPAYNKICGACNGGPCKVNGDCNGGYCVNGVCVSVPVINNVNPKEGGDGNFVTIYGSGFADFKEGVSQVLFSAGSGKEYTLPAALGCKAEDAWKDNQLIVVVPAGIEDGPIKVVTSSLDLLTNEYRSDDTVNDLGWIGDFSKNLNLQYPSLCSMVPASGSPGAYTTLGGKKFGSSQGSSDNVYFGDFSATVKGAWSDISITNVRVPQINKGIYNIVVGKGERCQKAKADCVAGSGSCLVDCIRETCTKTDGSSCESTADGCKCVVTDAACNCYNVMSNPLSFDLIESSSFPTITEVTPKVYAKVVPVTAKDTDLGATCTVAVPEICTKPETKITETLCEEVDDGVEGCTCTEDIPAVCTKSVTTTSDVSCPVENELEGCTCTPAVASVCTKSDMTVCTTKAPECVYGGTGPVNQIISITGTNFGDKTGQVIFSPLQSDGHGGFMEARDKITEVLKPSFIGILACGADSWSDTEVKVKVPETLPDGTTTMAPGNYWVKIITNQSLPSNNKNFIVNTNAPGPGICSISPNNGPMNTVVTVVGENFLATPAYDLSFDQKEVDEDPETDLRAVVSSTGVTWAEKEISGAKVPAAAMTGGVMVHSTDATRSIQSNSVNFKLGICTDTSCLANQFCCGDGVCKNATAGQTKQDVCATTVQSHNSEYAWFMSTGKILKIPAVIERTCMVTDGAGYLQSPSPAKDDKQACPNGKISATFNMTINESTENNNIIIRRCTTASETPCTFSACTAANNCVEHRLGDINGNDTLGNQPESVVCTITGSSTTCKPGDAGCTCQSSTEVLDYFALDQTFKDADYTDVVTPVPATGTPTRYDLYKNTWYQVEVVGGETGIASGSPGNKKMKESYKWVFKTKDTNCEPDKFLMTPSKGIIKSVDQTQKYLVQGMAGCQPISVEDKPWTWTLNPASDKAVNLGYGCIDATATAPLYCSNFATGSVDARHDIGVYAVNSAQLTCTGGNQFSADSVCEAKMDLETTAGSPLIVNTHATVVGSTLSYEKNGELEINFSEPKITSYYPNCKEACINAQLGASFNTKMKVPVKENIKIYTCETEECTVVTPSLAQIDSVTYVYNPATSTSPGNNILKIDLKPTTNLLFNKYHRVVISDALESISGVHLTGLNYHDVSGATGLNSFSWVFKTKNDENQCIIDTVNVVPANYEATTPGDVVSYSVEPRSEPDKCNIAGQILNPLHYPWTWSTKDSDNDVTGDNTNDLVFPNSSFPMTNVNDGAPLAEITNKVYNSAFSDQNKCTGNCLLKGSITYRAVCGDGRISLGEECDFSQATGTLGQTMMFNGTADVVVSGISCNDEKCLLNSFSPCTVAELASGSSVCCGNGRVNGQEECDLGAEYKDKNGASCDPAATTQANPPCALVSKSKACTAGCLNAGTAVGYTCGNGVEEAGEDADDSNNKAGDGVGNTCLNEGASIKYTAGMSICGNHVVEAGEKCDPLVSDSDTNKALCNDKCLVIGYPLCANPTDTLCCGNGNIDEVIPGLGRKACDKTSCFKDEPCPVQTANMVQCTGITATAGCVLMGTSQACFCGEDLIPSDKVKCTGVLATPGCTVQSDKCVCTEANTCGSTGKIKVDCSADKTAAGCVCDFPEGCTTKCTNLGSDIKYGSQCGNGTPEEGEDAACEVASTVCSIDAGTKKCMCGTVESDISKCDQGSPYQKATINTEESPKTAATPENDAVYQVILRLNPDATPKTSYSLTKKIIADTVEKIEGSDTHKTGDTGITLRVPESVYKQAVNATCEAGTALNPTTIPANNAQDVCRNAVLVLSTALTEIETEETCYCGSPKVAAAMANCTEPTKVAGCEREDTSTLFYYGSNSACTSSDDVTSLVLSNSISESNIWYVRAYDRVVNFVRSLLFKVGLAAPSYSHYCKAPEMKVVVKKTAAGIELRVTPKVLLPAETDFGIKFKNIKNKCGGYLTDLPLTIYFKTGKEACRLDNVVVAPADLFVMKSGQSFAYAAYAKSGINEIFPMPGVYNWEWSWESTDTALAQIVNPSGTAADVVTQTKNGTAQIKASARISEDALGQVCTNGSGASCTYGTENCYCSYSPGEESTTGATYTGTGNIKVFICDNPWFGDVYNSFNRSIPPEYQYNSGEAITHKKLDLKLELTNNGQLMPSYLVEKEFNAGLFYCRDFGKDKDLTDDLPLVGLMTGAFTEVNPNPRFGIYFDRNFDYVKAEDNLAFMNDKTSAWTVSTWVYNDDLPQDRYVRIFYKNLTTDEKTVPNQAHVQLGVRSWCAANPTCWSEVVKGNKVAADCTGCNLANSIKRSVVFEIQYPGQPSTYKGVTDVAGLLNDGFNQIVLRYRGEKATLFINGKEQCDLTDPDCGGVKTLTKETASLFVWPRPDICNKTTDKSTCIKNSDNCVCVGEETEAGSDFSKLFIGGLGKTKVPLVSFGGYIDDFRIFSKAKTPQDIEHEPETDLVAAWDFNSKATSNHEIGVANCTADYTASCFFADHRTVCTPGTQGCVCDNSSQCLQPASEKKFKHINITDVAKAKGIFYGDNSGWQELNVDTQNQCNNGIDDDNNGLIDSKDPKCTSATDGWEEPALFAQYFFVRKTDNDYASTNDNSPDAISLRIYENPEGLPPSLWYARNVPNPASSVPSIKSDCLTDGFGEFCYAGVQDGRTLYVSASNINGANVYNNIYLLSYSQGANPATQNIFGQLVQFLKFNMNELDSGTISKIKLIRDTQRLQDFVLMQEYINVYKSQHGGKVPQLEAGTLQRHNTNSVWDSWKTTFKTELGLDMPTDPVNRLSYSPPSYKASTAAGVSCKGGQWCILRSTVDCGVDSSGNDLACSPIQQCVVPGVACIDCSSTGAYDSKACYNSSTQTFASLYSYYGVSDKTSANYGKNLTYTYEANGADATQNEFRIRYFYEIPTLNYKYVPVVVPSAAGWDQLQVAPPELVVKPVTQPACSDGVDNDFNAKTDYPNDPGCTGPDDSVEDYVSMCKNNLDDDDDGTCDLDGCCSKPEHDTPADCLGDHATWKTLDPSCTSAFDNDEFWPAQCSDGVDNDGDLKCDFAGCTCTAFNKYCGTNDPSKTTLPADSNGCSEANDDSEGAILFAFFVDDSGSMMNAYTPTFVAGEGNDSAFMHRDLIRGIVDGVFDTDANKDIDGIDDVMGDKAYFTLGLTGNNKLFFPPGKRDQFINWLSRPAGWLNCLTKSVPAKTEAQCNNDPVYTQNTKACLYATCTNNSDCASNNCDKTFIPNVCGPAKCSNPAFPLRCNGSPCTDSSTCISQYCAAGTCQVNPAGNTLLNCSVTGSCMNKIQCASNYCLGNKCADNTMTNVSLKCNTLPQNSCLSKLECASNFCAGGVCTSPPTNTALKCVGASCTRKEECSTGACVGSVCTEPCAPVIATTPSSKKCNKIACSADADCFSNYCSTVSPRKCANKLNCINSNTGANRCDNKTCTASSQCASNNCTGGFCVPALASPTCSTQLKCSGTSAASSCLSALECSSGNCSNSKCTSKLCNNDPKSNSIACSKDADCLSGYCLAGSKICSNKSCNSNAKSNGVACSLSSDCISKYCDQATMKCLTPACNNAPKSNGVACFAHADCLSNNCSGDTCKASIQAPSCSSFGYKQCDGSSCTTGDNCLSNICQAGKCKANPAVPLNCTGPYTYSGGGQMPTQIQTMYSESLLAYKNNIDMFGSAVNFSQMVYIIFSDATDLDVAPVTVYTEARDFVTNSANINEVPIHFIYIRKSGDDATPEQIGFYDNYSTDVAEKFRGIFEKGDIATLKKKLPSIVSHIASMPQEKPNAVLEENY